MGAAEAKLVVGVLPRMSVVRGSSLVRRFPFLIFGFCLLALSGFAQTLPARSMPERIPNVVPGNYSDLLWSRPIRRGPLQADPRIMAAFLRPWLLSSRWFDLNPQTSTKSARTIPPPKTYPLTPDPLNW